MRQHTQAARAAEPPERADGLRRPAAPRRALVVGPPDDALERDASDAASDVMRGRRAAVRAATVSLVALRRLGGAESDAVQRALDGAGRPLPDPAREMMQSRFGCDFSRVRVHDDARAHAAADALRARAFAAGDDVVFARGQFRPDTHDGLALIAHELAHVAQQRRAGPARDLLFVQRADRISASARTRTLPAPPVRSFGPAESALGEINQIRNSAELSGLMAMTPAAATPLPADNAQTVAAERRSRATQRDHGHGLDAEQRGSEAQAAEAASALAQASDLAQGAAEAEGKTVEQQPVTLASVIDKGVHFAEPVIEGEFETEDERAAAALEARVNQTRAEAAMGEFALQGVDASAALKGAGLGIEPRLHAAADEAKVRIASSAQAQREAIAQAAKDARGKVSGREAGAKAKLEREYAAADKAIAAAYKADKLAVELHYGLKLVAFTAAEIAGALSITRMFKAGSEKFAAAGDAVSAKATAIGDEKAGAYAAEYAPDGDFLDGEDYYRRKRSARASAAKETAKQYSEAFAQQGKDAAAEVVKGDQDAITELGKQVGQQRDAAQAEYKKALADLEASYKAAKDSAKAAHDAQQSALNASAAGSRAAITRLEKALLKQLDEGEQQRLAQTDGNTAFALEQLILAVDATAGALEQSLAAGLLDLEQRQAPEAEALDEEMAESRAALDDARALSLEQLDGSVAAAAAQVLANAGAAAAQFEALAKRAIEQSAPVVASFDDGTTQSVRVTVAGLAKTRDDFVKGAADTRKAGMQGVDDAHADVVAYIADLEAKLPKAFESKAKEFQGSESSSEGLMAALYGKLPETTDIRKDIEAKAEEAADAIKPAWKEVVAFVLTVIITVVVAVAIAALVASGVGFGLGLLLAAGIGAMGGVAKAGVEAWRADKPLTWKDVGKAAVLGAVDGMLQFAGGRALKALKLPDTGWKKAATEGGSNFVQGVGNDFAGLGWDALVDGKTVGWKDFAGAAATNAIGAGLNVGAGGLFGKTKLKANQFEDALYKGALKDLGRKELVEGLKAKGKDVLINVTTNTLGDKELLGKAYGGQLTLDDVKKSALKNVAQEGITASVHYGMKKQRFPDKDAPAGADAPKKSVEDRLKSTFSNAGKAWEDYKQSKKAGGRADEHASDVAAQQPPAQSEGAAQAGASQPQATHPPAPQLQAGPQGATLRGWGAAQAQGEAQAHKASSQDGGVQIAQQQEAQVSAADKGSPRAKPPQEPSTPAPVASQVTPAGADPVAPVKPSSTEERRPAKPHAVPADDLASEPTRLRAKPADEDDGFAKPAKLGKGTGARKAGAQAAKAESGGRTPEARGKPKAASGAPERPARTAKERSTPGRTDAEAEAGALANKQPVETALGDLQQKIKAGDKDAVHSAAASVIKGAGDWKRDLKQHLGRMGKEERAQVEQALVEARDRIVAEAFAKVRAKYPDVVMVNVGTKSFGSDIDVTVKRKRRAGAGPQRNPERRQKAIADASKAALMLSKELRAATGGETDATLDTNVYAYLGEDDVRLKTDADRAAQSDTSRVLGLAEQKRGMTPKEWVDFKDGVRFNAGPGPRKGAAQADVEDAANAQINKDLRKAEVMVARLDKVRANAEARAKAKAPDATEAEIGRRAREDVLKKKRAELAREVGKKKPDLRKVLRLQSDILWFEPDAYASRAAIDQAVGGQTMRAAGSTSKRNQRIDRQLEDIARQLTAERQTPQPDAGKIAELENRADGLLEQRSEHTQADLDQIASARQARGVGNKDLSIGNKLSNAAGVASANLGMMKDHVRHAPDLDGQVKAAAKYGARIMQAEGDANLSSHPDRANQFGAFMQSRAPGLPKADADAIAKHMLDDFALKHGHVDADGAPKVDETTKRLFVQEIGQWAEDTTKRLHRMAATLPEQGPAAPAPAKPKASDPSKPTPEDDPDATVAKSASKPTDAPAEAPVPPTAARPTPAGAQSQPRPAVPAADMAQQGFVPIKPGKAEPTGLSGRLEGFRRTHIKTEAEATAHYHKWADQDPTREVALIYNHDSKTYEVVQGQSFSVKSEFVSGNKTVLKHFHHGADFAARLPSSADFSFFSGKNDPNKPWVSRVTYVNEMGEYHDTVFGYHPGDAQKGPTFWVKYVDKDGSTQFRTFNDPPWAANASYKQWKQKHLTIVPIRPGKPPAAVQTNATAKPAPTAPKFTGAVPPDYDDDTLAPLKNEPTRATAGEAVDPQADKPAGAPPPKARPDVDRIAAPPRPKPSPRTETVEEFLARGGKPTQVPPQPAPEPRVTAQPKDKAGDLSVYGDGSEVAAVQPADRRRAGMGNKPKHHVYPQELRKWFEKRGFTGDRDIDNFTLALDEDLHQAIHGGGDYRLGRRAWQNEWNTRVRRELLAAEAAKRAKNGRDLTYREARAIVVRLMQEYGLPGPRKFEKY